ncbi:tissue factor pathway inhibitor 2 [Rhineura floridana]|uniref:tissue factor pathway inhibitor 2 n=1 Tax=Rhineura floridana TaxID=261503 RepID=UPI002AC8093B|nr:tissue factor pathway inhibitor 2 [Rhineura floridana]
MMDRACGNSRLLLLAGSVLWLLTQVWSQTTAGDNKAICLQPPLKGSCRAILTRWYYDRLSQSCREFSYGGCEGNDNNFLSFGECSKTCSKIKKVPKICRLESDPGICRGLIPKYFFNIQTMKCEKFFYGGCLGNPNRYDDKNSCMDVCLPTRSAPFFCYRPKDEGTCSASVPRFYYNAKTKTCQEFNYTGCGGNNNNFLNQRACLKACKNAQGRKPGLLRPKQVIS